MYNNLDDTKLIREISLRLTAIRETFEELGVILCGKNIPSINSSTPFSKSSCESYDADWQHKVHSQKEPFLSFCEKFNLLPDLWNVYEWSAWLTPTNFEAKRFESAFFITMLNEMPEVHPELEHEVADFMVI